MESPGPYLGFFACGGKLHKHYVRKKNSFPGGGNCPLCPPAMYGPGVSVLGKPKPLAYLVEHHIGIHLRSEGCNDPTKTPGTCGIAYIYVDGIDVSPHLRGHNVVVLDAKTGNVFSRTLH